MNKFSRYFLSLLFLLSLRAPLLASNEPSQLVVKLKDNTEKIFVLANKPVITFDTGKFYINTTDFSAELSDVQEFSFKTEAVTPPTGIDDVRKDHAADSSSPFTFRFVDGKTVSISGLDDSVRIKVYSLSGTTVNARIERGNYSAVVDFGNQPAGVYIIQANKQSFKIIKR